jgi:hypothetical protein
MCSIKDSFAHGKLRDALTNLKEGSYEVLARRADDTKKVARFGLAMKSNMN